MFPKLNAFSKLIDDSVSELEKNETDRAKQIETIIAIVKKILRFIDRKILVNIHFQMDADDMKFVPQYHPEMGILIYVNNADNVAQSSITFKINDVFPQEQRESRVLHGTRAGEEVYLLRSGKLVSFTRTGKIWDAWSADHDDDYYSLSTPVELSPLDLVRKHGNFDQEFLFNFKLAIVNAIKRNDNKRAILKKVVEYINKLEKMDKTEADYEKEIALAPDNPQIYIEYAFFLLQKNGDIEREKKLFQRALELAPHDAQVHLKYAEFLLRHIQWAKYLHKEGLDEFRKEAEKEYLKALEIAPDSSEAHGSYADYLWMCEEKEKLKLLPKDVVEKAEAEFRKALDLNPNNTEALTDYAFFLYWVKGESGSIPALFDKVIEVEPLRVGNYLNYAGVLSMIGTNLHDVEKFKAAEKLYLKALEIDPENVDAHLTYTDFLMWTKHDLPAAEPYLRRLAEIKPEVLWIHARFGDYLLMRKEQLSEAEQQYRASLKLLESKPDPRARAEVFLRLATIAFLSEKHDEAMKDLTEIRATTTEKDILLASAFYAYLYEPNDIRRKELLLEIKNILKQGIFVTQWAGSEMIIWSIPKHIGRVTKAGQRDSKFLTALGAVIIKQRSIKSLEKFPEWQS